MKNAAISAGNRLQRECKSTSVPYITIYRGLRRSDVQNVLKMQWRYLPTAGIRRPSCVARSNKSKWTIVYARSLQRSPPSLVVS